MEHQEHRATLAEEKQKREYDGEERKEAGKKKGREERLVKLQQRKVQREKKQASAGVEQERVRKE